MTSPRSWGGKAPGTQKSRWQRGVSPLLALPATSGQDPAQEQTEGSERGWAGGRQPSDAAETRPLLLERGPSCLRARDLTPAGPRLLGSTL